MVAGLQHLAIVAFTIGVLGGLAPPPAAAQTPDAYFEFLMARRLVETGVPFVEVRHPNGWDLHQNVFQTLRNTNLPTLDNGISALVADLKSRGMFDDTVIVCMGEFGRTPRINQNVGRDHWASGG